MKKWLKRIRGVVGTALTWAAGWGVLGAIYALVTFVLGTNFAYHARSFSDIVWIAAFCSVGGFIGGAVFSSALGIAEGRRRFDEMLLPRFAGWGAAGGLLVSMLFVGGPFGLAWVLTAGVITLTAAGSAAGSLALARRAEDRELLEDGADVADIGLTAGETRELLGT